eukprot:3933115-Rhodomonas_salina.1
MKNRPRPCLHDSYRAPAPGNPTHGAHNGVRCLRAWWYAAVSRGSADVLFWAASDVLFRAAGRIAWPPLADRCQSGHVLSAPAGTVREEVHFRPTSNIPIRALLCESQLEINLKENLKKRNLACVRWELVLGTSGCR